MKPDICIPDLPKIVVPAASLGNPAVAARGGFRNGMLQLAREVAFVRLLEGAASDGHGKASGSRLHRLFGLRR
jgi:pilus assembly protein CpaE